MQYVRSGTRLLPIVLLVSGFAGACSDSLTAPDELSKRKPAVPDTVSITPPPSNTPTPTVTNPFGGARLFVDPNSNARKTATAWRSSRPADAAEMDKIASNSQADWFGDWNGDIRTAVDARTTTITNAGALPVFVAYNIPKRDCGSYSSGGASSADAYKAWIRGFAAGIGARKAVVILEPDALAAMSCLSTTEQQTLRTDLIKDAVQVFKSLANVSVYIDAGHSNWMSASTMINRLIAAGVSLANGFSLNVSNFQYNTNLENYGNAISAGIGGKHFILDTSRNGLGPGDTWCNPAGRALGTAPTVNTGKPLVDALLWIKRPGESDGSCNGWAGGGAFLSEYALGLAQRSVMNATLASSQSDLI